ncbi:MAG TPA: TetR/AcrR family transcriptional regulator C-terminal domain-containing protein [Xanthobacteraceae bacterium]|nr:TetR/AcrR family transcriptional regulator C-terminal domain-containing protein [Xanthobacteraceae bacterium]
MKVPAEHRERDDEERSARRASRSAGRKMRSTLLDVAAALFKAKGLSGVAIADIARAAEAFPSQVTYYFRSKEALFVEAACRDVLYVGRRAEDAASAAVTPEDYTRALAESVMAADDDGLSLGFFTEALMLTRRRPDLAPLVERTIERLHAEGLRAYAGKMAAHGWRSRLAPDVTARRFWALAIGLTLEGHAIGRAYEDCAADMLRLLDTQADDAGGASLALVPATGTRLLPSSSTRETGT